jgi:penicillin-binding protein 2
VTQLGSSRAATEGHVERRLALALLIVLVIWGALIARLFYLQVIEGDRYRVWAERNSVRTHRLIPSRGMILDRSGEILVDARPSFDVLVVPQETSDLGLTLDRVATLANLDVKEVTARLGEPRGRARFRALAIARDLDRDVLARIEARRWALPGVITQVSPIRDYRYGSSASHVLGRLGEINAEELERRTGYRPGDMVGKEGVERLLDREIRGREGGKNVLVDAHGRELQRLDEVAPQPGHNVFLTLDRRLQAVAEGAFAEADKNGAVVALDPRNGEVLALMSRPQFDPNLFSHGIASEEWSALKDDAAKPLLNRALQGLYPPGSTYKVVTALAGLETGAITPSDTVTCHGWYRLGRRRYRCWKRWGHGEISLHRALVESCDVYFYQLGYAVGVDQLAYFARTLGLGAKTGIDVGAEEAGLVPTRTWKKKRFGQDWLEGETISLSIGQGFNLWTPIQMAAAYASIANGGTRYRPRLVDRVENATGDVVWKSEPEVSGSLAISAESIEIVQRGLRGVVHDDHGTGYAMRRLPVASAGKTGTAQVVGMGPDGPEDEDDIPEKHRDHAWFVTYAPADDPRIVVAVLVEHGGHGASAAAPIARDIVAEFLKNEVLPDETGAAREEIHAGN